MAPSPDPSPASPAASEARAAPRRGLRAAGLAKLGDNLIAGLVVAVLAGLMLFSFNQINDRITGLETTIGNRFVASDARLTVLETSFNTRFAGLEASVNARFAAVEARLARLEESIEARLAAVDARFVRLEESNDARFRRLEENQQDMALLLARLVALLEGRDEAPVIASG